MDEMIKGMDVCGRRKYIKKWYRKMDEKIIKEKDKEKFEEIKGIINML
jgi:hypothetical protein